jgi:hypothetical protein
MMEFDDPLMAIMPLSSDEEMVAYTMFAGASTMTSHGSPLKAERVGIVVMT